MQPRIARIGEAPTVACILQEAFKPFRARYTAGSFDATVLDEDRLRERWDEGPVWLVGNVGIVSAVHRDDGVYLRSLAVLPQARGTGVGNALMAAVEDFARQQGAPRVYLSTTPFLDAAIRLYERRGYQAVDEPPHFLHGTPLRTFQKPLQTP